MENTNKTMEVSGCCEALILDADQNGNGRCANCKEGCTSYKDEPAREDDTMVDWEYEQYMAERFGGR